jgi:tetratricopeptide (TPR) repeat protein
MKVDTQAYGRHKALPQLIKLVVFLVLLIMAIPSTSNVTTAITSTANQVNKTDNVVSHEAILLNKKGGDLVKLGNFTGAIKYYDKALAINPNDLFG